MYRPVFSAQAFFMVFERLDPVTAQYGCIFMHFSTQK